jgi:TPR repeat protein
MLYYSEALSSGRCYSQSFFNARRWLQKWADGGSPADKAEFARRLSLGKGVVKDEAEANRYFGLWFEECGLSGRGAFPVEG